MPHQITNRKRNYRKSEAKKSEFLWEGLNASAYIIGAGAFVVGSIFFLPTFQQYSAEGAWLFIVGSLIYLIVTFHDFFETIAHYQRNRRHSRKTVLELLTSTGYVIACVLFLIGSLCFMPSLNKEAWGGGCFIVGSILFATGSSINVTQITQVGSLFALQLMNAVAITFIIGSVLFLVASIPYLWPAGQSQLPQSLYTYLAAQYIFASILFLVGGLANFYRVYQMHHCHQAKKGGDE